MTDLTAAPAPAPTAGPKHRVLRTGSSTLIAFALVTLSVMWLAGKGMLEASLHARDLTLDIYGEADVARAASRFLDLGFTDHAGIPDVAYGDLFAKQGGKFDKQELCAEPHDCFYTHNPPGSVYLYALVSALHTPANPYLPRIVNVLLCVAALGWFLRAVWKWLSPWNAAVIAVLLTQIPMVGNNMHGTCYHGHLMALFLAEMAVALTIVMSGKITAARLIALGLLTFVSGWFSYEFAGICAFSPLLVTFLRDDWRERASLKRALWLTLVAGGGFTLAQVLHLVQSAVFFGSFRLALRDLATAGAKRTSGVGSSYKNNFVLGHPIGTWLAYWTSLVGRPEFFDGNFFAWLLSSGTVLALRGQDSIILRWRGYGLHWAPRRRYVFVVTGALLVASMWITAMPQHAFVHVHFLPRQFTLVCIVVMFVMARVFRIRPLDAAADPVPSTT